MNRIFHARIVWYQYVLLVILTSTLISFLWFKFIIPAAFLAVVLLVVIEQIIHTSYIVTTDNKLIVSRGRFSKKKIIPISTIIAIRKYHSMKIGRYSVTNYLIIEYNINKYISLMPVKEQEFVNLIQARF